TEAVALPPACRRAPDLRVLAARASVVDPVHGKSAMADGVPVLAVHARDLTGVVGPLVVAGVTACLQCLDLHRADRDPQWPLVAAQLANRRLVQPQPVSLLAILAGHTVGQGLAFLDGDESVATRNGTLELSPPDWRGRRRGWLPHPDCGCVWPLADEAG
ncbi:MAG: UBA/THIF-type binding protein, partial [Frankiales bacterium]|nr:UBA/THIF-type binding protein [Frankiales bacterium]